MNGLDEKALSIIAKVEKLLALANHPNTDEAEATAAASAAQKLLEAYNLDMTTVERHSRKSGARGQEDLLGGLYKWQRELWRAVADLNFCIYKHEQGLTKGAKYKHRLIGRISNVRVTQMTAEYLQGAIERIAREWAGEPREFFTKSAISYREGMADRVVERLRIRRQEEIEREEARKRGEGARQSHPAYAGTKNALVTLTDVRKSEYEANLDVLYGEGYSARRRAAQAEAEAAYEARIAARAKWELENPEAFAAEKAAREKQQAEWDKREARNARRRKGRAYYGPRYKGDSDAYWEGHAKGADIGLDQQVGRRNTEKLS